MTGPWYGADRSPPAVRGTKPPAPQAAAAGSVGEPADARPEAPAQQPLAAGAPEAPSTLEAADDAIDGVVAADPPAPAIYDWTGAEADEDEARWEGVPLEPYTVGDPGRAAREVVASLSENPADPSDTQVDGATVGALVIRAASTRGMSHRHNGTPRQDDYALCLGGDRWIVAAVADGVSAGAMSHQAATLACRGASALVRDALMECDELTAVPWEDILQALARRIVGHGRRMLANDRPDEDIGPADVAAIMATTLVVAALPVAAEADGSRTGVVLAVGDTSVFLLDAAGSWTPVTQVKNEGAQIASSATLALPYLPAGPLEPMPFCLEAGHAVFVMTDGVGDPLGRGDGPVGRFLAEVWEQPPDPLSFGGQVGFARRSFDDDRTVVGIWARA